MQRDLELEYDEIIFGLTLDSLRFSYENKIPLFTTTSNIHVPPKYDLDGINIKKKEFEILRERICLLSLFPCTMPVQSARLENDNSIKFITLNNLVIKVRFKKIYIDNICANSIEEMPAEYSLLEHKNLIVDSISVRSGLYHEYDLLETGDDFVKKIYFYLSERFFYKNIDNKKDCFAISLIKQEDSEKFEFSEIAARMKTAKHMKEAGIKGRWDKTNGFYKPVKLESEYRKIYPQYKIVYKNLPDNFKILYDIPPIVIKEENLYGEIQKIPVQQN